MTRITLLTGPTDCWLVQLGLELLISAQVARGNSSAPGLNLALGKGPGQALQRLFPSAHFIILPSTLAELERGHWLGGPFILPDLLPSITRTEVWA